MTITIYTEPIILEVRQRSHLSVQDIKDAEARDNARAGLDKMDEIERCIIDAFGQLSRHCGRFLERDYTLEADNMSGIPNAYAYEFSMSARRAANKAEALEEAMHGFVVQAALARFYTTVSNVDRAGTHTALAADYANQLNELLYTKQPPLV